MMYLMFLNNNMHHITLLLCLFAIQSKLINGNNSIFGIKTKDSVYISATSTVSHNGVTLLENYKWIRMIGTNVIIGLHGDISDCDDCFSWIQSRNKIHELEFNGRSLDCKSIAYLCRNLIASKLRTNQRMNVQILIGGYNLKINQPQLYWIDDIGSIQLVDNFAVHGKETPFILSLLDQHINILSNHEKNLNHHPYDYMNLIKNIWIQSHKRSNQRIDISKVNVYNVDRTGCSNMLLTI